MHPTLDVMCAQVRDGGDSMVRWGVIGTGGIAQRFATAVERCPGSEIVALASRSAEAGDAFGDRVGVSASGRHRSLDGLVADRRVDAVYVATPNHRHHLDTIAALEAGKHVLCEKPFALDHARATSVIDVAARGDRFLMEAIWSRFLPAYQLMIELLEQGALGAIRVVDASFGFAAPMMPGHRLFDRALGGGSLLDVGIYPLQLCSMVLGPPDRIAAVGTVGVTGVDEITAVALHHADGGVGTFRSAITANLSNDAWILGELGTIELPAFMHCPDRVILTTGGRSQVIDASFDGDGLRFQIEEVERCLAEGLTESPTMPLSETLSLAATMDEIRRAIGVDYPEDVVK